MTTKRKHKNTPRITAAERVAKFEVLQSDAGIWISRWERAYLIKAFAAHARDTLARHRRRVQP